MAVLIPIVLTACVGSARTPLPSPTASAPSAVPSATAEPIDPTVRPSNRYGIDCDSLMASSDLVPVFGAALPLDVTDTLNGSLSRELTQDRVLQCRWGADRYWDESVPSLTVVAAPYGRASLDSHVASYTPDNGNKIEYPMDGIGDAAWAGCAASAESLSCSWTVAVEDTWLVVNFSSVLESEADITRVTDYLYDAVPRVDSAGAALVGRIVETLGASRVAEVPAPTVTVPPCDSLADWTSLAAEFGTGTPTITVSSDIYSSTLYTFVLGSIHDMAAQNRGARSCVVDFSHVGDDGPRDIVIHVIPDAAWIGGMAEWAGGAGGSGWDAWNAESCHGGEGGYRCEVSGFVNSKAASVSIFGTPPDGLATRVLNLVTAVRAS